MDVSMDASEVDRLAAELTGVSWKMVPAIRAVVERGAFNVKREMVKDATGHSHAPAFPRSITYDIRGLSAEIGPDKNKRQGALANILYFGTSKNAPVINLTAAIEREAPRFEQALADVGRGVLVEAVEAPLTYTTRSGVTRTATQAQIDNWTRGYR